MRLALVWLLALTATSAAAPAITPTKQAITAQDLRDVANGERDAGELTDLIPMKDRLAAIHKLIRAGGSCKITPESCANNNDYEAPDDAATSKSPCFRRWHLYTLLYDLPVDDPLTLDAAELRAATKLDDGILSFIGSDLDQRQQVELAHLLREKKRDVPFTLTLDDAVAVKAVKQYHLDEAVASIDAEASKKVLIGVVLDSRYKAAVRADTIDRLSDLAYDDDPLYTILRPLIADPSLQVAAQAAYRTGADLTRPPTNNPAVFMRALSLYAEAQVFADDALTFAPKGLDIVSPAGELLDHVDDPEGVRDEIRQRLRTQPPLFGTDAKNHIILKGFVDTPVPEMDACQQLEMDGY
ncbi:MAG TPA: hypothetical protein VL326_14900 [Kofleriaceae bacterium]|nr:hypothetical protein [Kofleriaceae bacterium]